MLADRVKRACDASFEDLALHYPCNMPVFTLTSSPPDVASATDIIAAFLLTNGYFFRNLKIFLPRICAH